MHKPLLWAVIIIVIIFIIVAVFHFFSPFAFHFGTL